MMFIKSVKNSLIVGNNVRNKSCCESKNKKMLQRFTLQEEYL